MLTKKFYFHRFPANDYLRAEWEKNVNVHTGEHTYFRLCSQHFADDCFESRGLRRRLKRNAIPTIFDFPLQLQPKRPKIQVCSNDCSVINMQNSEFPFAVAAFVDIETSTDNGNILNPSNDLCEPVKTFTHQTSQTDLTCEDIAMFEKIARDHATQCSDQNVKKQLNAERVKTSRLRKKVSSLKDMMDIMKEKAVISAELVDQLLQNGGNDILTIIENELSNRKMSPEHQQYSDDMKKFALTIYFHSPAAYRYLRSHISLPHERTISRWLSKTDASPGFTAESIEIIESRLQKGEIEAECALIVDSMSIRKQVIYCSNEGRNLGYVDMGTGNDDPRLAGEALVFLVSGLKTKWRYPIGYFFVGKL